MANEYEDINRQPRWNIAGYWTPRRVGEDWRGDRPRVRDYGREDMRRLYRRALREGQKLRRMRGRGRRRAEWNMQRGFPGRAPARRQPDYELAGRPVRWPWPSSEPIRARPGVAYPRDRRPGDNLVDNYWGRREQGRDYRIRYRGAWWNNLGGRLDLTSARHPRNDLPTHVDFDWSEDRDYGLGPGYEYEFGTDFDVLQELDRERHLRSRGAARPAPPFEEWDEEFNKRPGPERIAGEFEYGWQGRPYKQRARYREVWGNPMHFSRRRR